MSWVMVEHAEPHEQVYLEIIAIQQEILLFITLEFHEIPSMILFLHVTVSPLAEKANIILYTMMSVNQIMNLL